MKSEPIKRLEAMIAFNALLKKVIITPFQGVALEKRGNNEGEQKTKATS